MKALVTGSAGFLGSHVAEWLTDVAEVEVVALDDLSGGFVDNVPSKCRWVEASVLDYGFLKELFKKEKFDFVYHLAAYAAEGLSHFIRRFNYSNNLIGSANLLNLSVLYGIRCFVFTSSIAVYGRNQLPMTEDFTPQPEDPYGIAKYAVELDLSAAYHQFGLNHVIFRPHNVYGERQNIGDRYRNVIGIFMNQILQNQPMTIFGDGEQTRAFSYIADVAPYIAQSAFKPDCFGQIFNVGSDAVTSLNNLARLVAGAMSVEPRFHYLSARNEVKHAYASHGKIRQFFDCKPSVPLEEGIHRMAQWVQKVGSRQSKPFGAVEVPMRLPEGWVN